VLQFLASNQQPLGLYTGRLGVAPLQALRQGFPRRWEDKHIYGIQTGAAVLGGALYIDHQKDILSRCRGHLDRLPQGAIQLAIELGPLQELTKRHPLRKNLAGQKVVLASILLAGPWRSCSTRHYLYHVGHLRHKPLTDRRFSGP
jgi:hypothetical protein